MQLTDLPDRFYKFMRHEHAEAMCSVGEVRIGTLYEYRNAELYTDGVLDEGEGSIRAMDTWDHVTKETAKEHSPVAQNVFRLGDGVIVTGIQFIVDKHQAPDRLIYCVSDTSDWSAASDQRYDACVEIHGVPFFQALANAMCLAKQTSPLQGVLNRVQYIGREYDWKEKPPIAELVKEPKYQNQREWRFIWLLQEASLQYVLLRSPEIAKYVHSFAVR